MMTLKKLLEMCVMLKAPVGIKVGQEHWRWKSVVEELGEDFAVIRSAGESMKGQRFIVPFSQITFIDADDVDAAVRQDNEKKLIEVPKILKVN